MFIPPMVTLEYHSKLVISTTYIAHLTMECIGYIPPYHHPPPITLTTHGPLTLQGYYTTSSSQDHLEQAIVGWTWAILYISL
jgi:hypothetical protein